MPYSITLDDITAGRSAPIFLQSFTGLGQSARIERVPSPYGGQVPAGVDLRESRELVAEIMVEDASPAVVESYVDALIAAWSPTGVTKELTVELAGPARIRRGRPTGVEADISNLPNGFVPVRCTFDAFDTRWYSAILNTVTVTVADTSGGMDTTGGMTTPMVTTGSGSTGDIAIFNGGSAPAPWWATISVPDGAPALVAPRLMLAGKTIQFTEDAIIPPGGSVTINSANRQVFFDGQPRPWVRFGSPWFEFPPGASTLSFRATSGVGTASVSWRDAKS